MKKYQAQFEMMREKMKPQIPLLFSVLGFSRVDYSFESLLVLEKCINEKYPHGHEPLSTTVMFIGFYVGEVMVKHIPSARWEIKGENPFKDWKITADMDGYDDFAAYPVQRVQNFWFDRTDTIWGWAGMIRDIQSGAVDPTKSTPFQWQDRGDGTAIRFVGMVQNKGKKK